MSEQDLGEQSETSRQGVPDPGPVLEPEPATYGAPDPSLEPPFTHTRASGFWAAVVGGLVVLVLLIVFILENGQEAKVSFVGAHGHLPQGVALLLAAVIGGLFVVVAAIARMLELRRRAVRQKSPGRFTLRRSRARSTSR